MLTMALYYGGGISAMKSEEEKNPQSLDEKDVRLLEQVENALFRRATGYEDDTGKFIQPDVRAAMYWLENRCPERWKKSRREVDADDGSKNLTDEENLL